jgi:hypothetical protein
MSQEQIVGELLEIDSGHIVHVKPGDMIIVRSEVRLSHQVIERLKVRALAVCPDLKVLVLDPVSEIVIARQSSEG